MRRIISYILLLGVSIIANTHEAIAQWRDLGRLSDFKGDYYVELCDYRLRYISASSDSTGKPGYTNRYFPLNAVLDSNVPATFGRELRFLSLPLSSYELLDTSMLPNAFVDSTNFDRLKAQLTNPDPLKRNIDTRIQLWTAEQMPLGEKLTKAQVRAKRVMDLSLGNYNIKPSAFYLEESCHAALAAPSPAPATK